MKRFICLSFLILLCLSPLLAESNDQYLKTYLDMGLHQNLALKMAQDRLVAAHARKSGALAGFLPSLDLTSSLLKQDVLTTPVTKATSTTLEATQLLFSPSVYINYSLQNQLSKSEKFSYETLVLNTEFSIVDAYYNCLKAASLLELRQNSLLLARENLRVITALYDVEKVPQTDLLRAQLGVMTGEQDVQAAQNQLQLARNFFNNLLNRDMNETVNMETKTPDSMFTLNVETEFPAPQNVETAVQTAFQQRNEIKQGEAALRATVLAKKLTFASYLPNVVGIADYNLARPDYKAYTSADDGYTIMGVLSWNLFSGFSRGAKTREVNAQIREMENSIKSIRHGIELDVRNSYVNYQNDRKQFDVARQTYKTAEANYNMVQKQYENELAPVITLMDAKNLLDASKINLLIGYYNILVSRVKFDISLGQSVYSQEK
jgi:outer membrane protein TolC